jgi:hypothetical protein
MQEMGVTAQPKYKIIASHDKIADFVRYLKSEGFEAKTTSVLSRHPIEVAALREALQADDSRPVCGVVGDLVFRLNCWVDERGVLGLIRVDHELLVAVARMFARWPNVFGFPADILLSDDLLAVIIQYGESSRPVVATVVGVSVEEDDETRRDPPSTQKPDPMLAMDARK